MKITIYWVTRDWELIRKLRDKYKIPQYTTVNGLTEAEVNEETLNNLRKGEPKYLIIRKIEQSDKSVEYAKRNAIEKAGYSEEVLQGSEEEGQQPGG